MKPQMPNQTAVKAAMNPGMISVVMKNFHPHQLSGQGSMAFQIRIAMKVSPKR